MALINCPECGKEFSDKASSCPNCGCPIAQPNYYDSVPDKQRCISYTRLSLSILMILFALFIIYQSLWVGIVNLSQSNDNYEGTMGLFLALFQITYGIIGIVTHRSTNFRFLKILGVIIALTGISYIITPIEIYEDLPIWGGCMFIVGIIFFGNAYYLGRKYFKKPINAPSPNTVSKTIPMASRIKSILLLNSSNFVFFISCIVCLIFLWGFLGLFPVYFFSIIVLVKIFFKHKRKHSSEFTVRSDQVHSLMDDNFSKNSSAKEQSKIDDVYSNNSSFSLTQGEMIAYRIILVLGAIYALIIIVLAIYRIFINPF